MSIESTLKGVGVAEVLVTLKDVPRGNTAAISAAQSRISGVLRHFTRSEQSHASAMANAAGAPDGRRLPYRVYKNLGLILGTVDSDGLARLKKESAVKAVDEAPVLSLIRPVAASTAAAPAGITWGIKRMRVQQLWSQGLTGKGVLVGHLDTGVDGKHKAFAGGAIAHFAEFDHFGDQIPGVKPHDSALHGTHTAGIIVGRTVGNSRFGVAPGAQLASALVIEGGDVVARILGGMDWIIGAGARVLSMSLGLRGYRKDFLPLMQAIRNRGILPVIAVGNEGPGTSRSPGNYDIVLSVGAMALSNHVPDFSSSQRLTRPRDSIVPDIVAPGVNVLSSLPHGGFGRMSGSSMATPHIAGLAALLWQAKPHATIDEIENAIFQSCKRPPAMPLARANRGVPDAVDALAILQSGGAKTATKVAKKKSAAKTSKHRRKE